MIGSAVAAWAWGEPRATLDLDVVVNIPIESVGRLSKELEKRDMLVPADIIFGNILETRWVFLDYRNVLEYNPYNN